MGSIVVARRTEGGALVEQQLAPPGGALARLYALAAEHGLDPLFSPAVEQEVQTLLEHPGIDDPALVDLTELPFVTIDGEGTRDLDQALFIEAEASGYRVDYALADPSYWVRPGTILFDEALRRGASYYLPGLAISMLPRALSEGIVSLNPDQLRRAMVMRMQLDGEGHCRSTTIVRARIRSRAQLTFDQVQRFLEGEGSEQFDRPIADSLRLLRVVGRLRMEDAERRDVIRYRRTETDVKLGEAKLRFVVIGGVRSDVERYNEQLSLLCNVQGARFLRQGENDEQLQPIYRVHPSPDPERYAELEALLEALCRHHDLDRSRWLWRRSGDRSLASFLEGLPTKGRYGRIAKAIHRQAVLINVRSTYSDSAQRHYGVGAEVYARFSAPMREIVGVFLHKETFERLGGASERPAADDDELRQTIVERANQARELQKQLTKRSNLMVLDQLFEGDARRPEDKRPRRTGTVMGLTHGKIFVLLDSPAVEVKVYVRHLQKRVRQRIALSDDGTQLEGRDDGATICRLGDPVTLLLVGRDERDGSWKLTLC